MDVHSYSMLWYRVVSAALTEARSRIVEELLQVALGYKPSDSGVARVADNLSISKALSAKASRMVNDQNVNSLATVAKAFLSLRHAVQEKNKATKNSILAWFDQHLYVHLLRCHTS